MTICCPGFRPVSRSAAGGALADARHEVLDDLEVDVGLEQREADLAQGDVEVGLGDPCLAAEALGDALQARRERFEHEWTDAE